MTMLNRIHLPTNWKDTGARFSWGGPSDELRAYVNENKEIHRLEYWYLDWGDGAKLELQPDEPAWQRMTEMIGLS